MDISAVMLGENAPPPEDMNRLPRLIFFLTVNTIKTLPKQRGALRILVENSSKRKKKK